MKAPDADEDELVDELAEGAPTATKLASDVVPLDEGAHDEVLSLPATPT